MTAKPVQGWAVYHKDGRLAKGWMSLAVFATEMDAVALKSLCSLSKLEVIPVEIRPRRKGRK